MYSLPGDVIVYEQVAPEAESAAGYVDIRTCHGFVSDTVWQASSYGMVSSVFGRNWSAIYE